MQMSGHKLSTAEIQFFDGHEESLPLYEIFAGRLFSVFPDAGIRVQKTQITFTNPKVFACVSFLKARKAKDRPKSFIVVTFGLDHPVEFPRIDAAVEISQKRWTHHVTVDCPEEIDDELMEWVKEAYLLSAGKVR